MGVLRSVYRFFCKAEELICGIGFMVLIGFVFLSAILRFFHISTSWIIDVALLLLSWTAFLGADIAWRKGQLVGVDLATRNLPKVLQKIIQILVYLIIGVALVIIAFYGLRLAWTERIRTYQSIPIPYSLVTLSLIVMAISMVFSTALKIRRCVLNFGKKE